ncbi:hypothetical protein [Sphingomonas bacterium]|uniref:hypothetical protein n=1 Tax=Sphingomonas bacterium TaxID=1895847 RepID=UPI001574FBB4|nr:hypothetical protein [Sphingomonas bacterium]
MSRPDRRLELPEHWISVSGLWLDPDGLRGSVFDEATSRVLLFEGVRVIAADVTGWSVGDVVACLVCHDTPRGVEPRLTHLSDAELAPLVACGALTRIERLRLLAHVPGWQP